MEKLNRISNLGQSWHNLHISKGCACNSKQKFHLKMIKFLLNRLVSWLQRVELLSRYILKRSFYYLWILIAYRSNTLYQAIFQQGKQEFQIQAFCCDLKEINKSHLLFFFFKIGKIKLGAVINYSMDIKHLNAYKLLVTSFLSKQKFS